MRSVKNFLLSVWVLIIVVSNTDASSVENAGFDSDWYFCRGDIAGAEDLEFNDSGWRMVDLPHDWSIEDIAIDGELEPGRVVSGPFDSAAIGSGATGYTVGGTGWYRKHFELTDGQEGMRMSVLFDGVYMDADIWVNGQYVGNHYYGYTAFRFDLTEYLKPAGHDNVIAVRVKNEGRNSRWYSGSGIYRHVTVSFDNDICFEPWGVFIHTLSADSGEAEICVTATLNNHKLNNQNIELQVDIIGPDSRLVATKAISAMVLGGSELKSEFKFKVSNPLLWDIDSPNMYNAVCSVRQGNLDYDKVETAFGIRTVAFDSEKGFFLNGKSLKLKGGAMHANNGLLGAAAYDRAEERRLEIMKSCGFNAVRCVHNPPSKAFLDACDRIGMLAIEEAFDVWSAGWLPQDYHSRFDECWQGDIDSMIMRDRNHPSIFTWGIGNQIKEGRESVGVKIADELASYVRSLDPTRPVTANVAMFIGKDWLDGAPELWRQLDSVNSMLDICGYSYQSSQYVTDHDRMPDRIMFSSEINPRHCFKNWMRAIDNEYVLGNFTWTAMDYMGEAGSGWFAFSERPKSSFPWNMTYTGDIDSCGFRRPRSFYRDVLFNPEGNSLSVFVQSR